MEHSSDLFLGALAPGVIRLRSALDWEAYLARCQAAIQAALVTHLAALPWNQDRAEFFEGMLAAGHAPEFVRGLKRRVWVRMKEV